MANDWFRRKTWTELDRKAFFERLDRSRSTANKAQYLRIQAVELLEVGTKESTLAAINLLQILLEKYPAHGEIALAYSCLGECQEFLGQLDDAIDSYRKALQHQRIFPNMRTNAHLDFAQLVAVHRMQSEYGEALSHLDEWSSPHIFPVMEFMEFSARAMIQHEKGENALARQCARRALDAAARTHSGLRYHATLGLVGERWVDQLKQLRKMVADDQH